MDILLKDIRHGLRSWFKQPGFVAVVIIMLALGIGANTTIFSVVNALILSPLSIAEADRVVAIWTTPKDKHINGQVSFLELQDWRARRQSFEDIAGYKTNGINLTQNGEVERIRGMRVTANFFPVMKVNLFRGRNFQPDEETPAGPRVAIVSYEFWQSRLGGEQAALDPQIYINNKPYAVIGVLPQRFKFPLVDDSPEVWTTIAAEGSNLPERGARVLQAVGRMKPNVSLEQGQAELATIASSLEQQYPETNRNRTAYLVSAEEQIVGKDMRRALWLLVGAVGFVLLIACTNIANLLLVRASVRQKEIALRAALGAGRWRIARQLITESALLSLLGGGAGLLVATWGIGALRFFAVDQLPRLDEIRIDGRVLLFTLGVSLLTGLLFSLVPILKAARPDVNEVLKATNKTAPGSRSTRWWRDSLVVAEIALSLILLICAGLMIRSFAQLLSIPPGFDPKNVLTGRISFTQPKYEGHDVRVDLVNQTLDRFNGTAGVEAAAFVAPMPFSGGNVAGGFQIKGQPRPEAGLEPSASMRSVTSQYFQAMGIPLLKGRYFSEQDRRGGVGAAIVNQALAQSYFRDQDPIGQHLSNLEANQNEGDPQEWQIVGVVGDVHHNSLTTAATPEIYLPYQQNSWNWGNFIVRTTVEPEKMTTTFRQVIRASDKSVAITEVQPLSAAISETLTESRFYTFLFALFGAIGLVLSMTGVYGLIAYTVSQRTQEIGIRMALGATTRDVVRVVVRRGLGLALLGTVVGLAVSFALTRVIVALLFEVKPNDLFTFVVATSVLLGAALLATYIPARKASRVDPLVALRYE